MFVKKKSSNSELKQVFIFNYSKQIGVSHTCKFVLRHHAKYVRAYMFSEPFRNNLITPNNLDNREIVRSQNSRTPNSDLNISEFPLNKKEIGNTLETRGLTYPYTFLTKPKNAHLRCKDTKQIPSCQMVSYTFFKFIAKFVFIGLQTTLFGHSNEQNPVCHFTYISVPDRCRYP